MKKKKSGGGGANWMDTYGDMVTLLLCFFVMLYSMSTLDKEKWIALVQSFNPTEEVTETQPPSASGGEGTGTQEDIDQDMEELYQAMQDYVQQAGMANQVTLGEGNGYVFISFDDTVFFSGDSYELRDEGKVVLDEVSQIIRGQQLHRRDPCPGSYRPGRARPGEQRHGGPLPGLQPCHSGYYLPTGKRHN